MRNLRSLSLMVLFWGCAFAISAQANNSKVWTVCTASINNPQEIETFQKRLDPKQFKFVELTKLGDPKKLRKVGNLDWLENACDMGIKCDVYLESMHLGGNIWGDSTGIRFQMESMEELGCKRKCDGIFKNVKEVFLMGCSTLSEKAKDTRTPEEYLEVLRADHVEEEVAQRAVETRYGSIGWTFLERDRFLFAGADHIYGYNSRSAGALTASAFLNRYFNKVGDYSKHLSETKSFKDNTLLAHEFKSTSFAQTIGAKPGEAVYEKGNLFCEMNDRSQKMSDRIEKIKNTILGPWFLDAIPLIQHFFESYKGEYALSLIHQSKNTLFDANAIAKVFQIRNDPKIRRIFSAAIEKTNSPLLKSQLYSIFAAFDWITDAELKTQIRTILLPEIKAVKPSLKSVLCSVGNTLKLDTIFTHEDFDSRHFQTPELIDAIGCTKSKDPILKKWLRNTIQRNLTSDLYDPKTDLRRAAVRAYGKMVSTKQDLRYYLTFSKDEDLSVVLQFVQNLSDQLKQTHPVEYEYALVELMKKDSDNWYRTEIANAAKNGLLNANIQTEDVILRMAQYGMDYLNFPSDIYRFITPKRKWGIQMYGLFTSYKAHFEKHPEELTMPETNLSPDDYGI